MAVKQDYVRLIKALLPPGPAWPVDDTTSPFAVVIDEIADLCATLDSHAAFLVEEADPTTAVQSFEDWEFDWGLPDDCVLAFSDGDLSIDQRRALLVFKASLSRGQSREFFQSVARLFGREIEIEENLPGESPFTWRVNVLTTPDSKPYREATVMMQAKDPLATFGDSLLECEIRKLKPAHTTVLFAYPE